MTIPKTQSEIVPRLSNLQRQHRWRYFHTLAIKWYEIETGIDIKDLVKEIKSDPDLEKRLGLEVT